MINVRMKKLYAVLDTFYLKINAFNGNIIS